ncbi:unnamed protein product [Notodromas monacha]|uniref:DM2 domain-containing protein n=1 Tax=Notodromas monacha TaxID=399045 RepID=A0A7R9GDU2_9CRUS|nr:unnamed protein product [Notodromas monacha]CAG0917312.1 unnamed protein product [Notodromas monacha]
MFSKPFRVKSSTALKSSERKKLKHDLVAQYPELGVEEADNLIPPKAEVLLLKLQTHSKGVVHVYSVENTPIFFTLGKEKGADKFIPTLYASWKCPKLSPLPHFSIHVPVVKVLQNGADLMVPGLVLPKGCSGIGPKTFGVFTKGQPCSISTVDNSALVALGTTALDESDLYMCAGHGKAVTILHIVGDHLWQLGPKSQRPILAPLTDLKTSDESDGNRLPEGDEEVDDSDNSEDHESPAEVSDVTNEIEDACHNLTIDDGKKTDGVEMAAEQLLIYCLFKSLKTSAKKLELPCLTSNFYRLHVLPACPDALSVDVKKSKFKKVSVFLREVVADFPGLLKIEETAKGVESIVGINYAHDCLRSFKFDASETKVPVKVENAGDGSKVALRYNPPDIVELHSVTAAVLPLLKGRNKGDALSTSEIRDGLTEYIKDNQLNTLPDQRVISLDPVLASVVLKKGENNVMKMQWAEMISRTIQKMTPAYKLTFQGQDPIYKKGAVPVVSFNVLSRAGNKKMFKKPKKNFRLRETAVEGSDDEEKRSAAVVTDQILDHNLNGSSVEKENTKKKEKKKVPKPTIPSEVSLLSFGDELEGDDGEVFKVKKSSQSKKLKKLIQKERTVKPKDEEEVCDVTQSETSGTKEILDEDDKPFLKVKDMPVSTKKTERDGEVLTGLEAESTLMEYEEESEEEHDPRSRHTFSDPFKRMLESGVVPTAAMIHEARKRRQRARELGESTEFIRLPDKNKEFLDFGERKQPRQGSEESDEARLRSSRAQNQSRLVREEDHDRSDDEGDGDNVIAFAFNRVAKEKEQRMEAFLDAEGHESDGEIERWEAQQIRKAFGSTNQREAMRTTAVAAVATASGHFADWDSSVTAPLILEDAKPFLKASSILGEPSFKSLASLRESEVTADLIRCRIKEKLDTLREVHRRHQLDCDKVADELISAQSDIDSSKSRKPEAASKYGFFQELRGYVMDFVECMDEKMNSIEKLEARIMALWRNRANKFIERRRLDVKDEHEGFANSTGVSGNVKKLQRAGDEELRRRIAEREGRRLRRKRAREIDRKKVALPAHFEGMSSDDEETDVDMKKMQQELGLIQQDARGVFADTIDDFCLFRNIKEKFREWKAKDEDSYKNAFVPLCLPKIFSPLVRLGLLFWNPLEADCEEIESMEWFTELISYCANEDLNKDPDVKLVSFVVERTVLPKLSNLISQVWDPLSTSKTLRLVTLVKRLTEEYPSVTGKSKHLQNLLKAIIERMKGTIESDIFIPLYQKTIFTSRPEAGAFLNRQFWTCAKALGNFVSWQGIISDKTLQTIAVDSLVNRYMLLALSQSISVFPISSSLPRCWFAGGNSLSQLAPLSRQIKELADTVDIYGSESKSVFLCVNDAGNVVMTAQNGVLPVVESTYDVDPFFEYQFRVILVGDSGVGKTSILQAFTDKSFFEVSDPTVGVDFFSKVVQLNDGSRIKLQLWDTAGQERFRSITRSYYRNTAAALVVYDVTNRQSFEHLKLWLTEIEKNAGPVCDGPGPPSLAVIFLVGAKSDLSSQRAVLFSEAAAAADACRDHRAGNVCGAFEVSARTGSNVDLLFHAVAREIMARIDAGLLRVDEAWDGVKPGFIPVSGPNGELRSLAANGFPMPLVYGEPVKKVEYTLPRQDVLLECTLCMPGVRCAVYTGIVGERQVSFSFRACDKRRQPCFAMAIRLMRLLHYLVLCSSMVLVAISGDLMLDAIASYGWSPQKQLWSRAVIDNVTHAIVAGFTWAIFVYPKLALCCDEVFYAAFVGSFIDMDHFIAACSLRLQDAIALHHRPLFHCTSFVMTSCAALYVWGQLQHQLWIRRLALVIAVSALSHHIRDGYRRGIWLSPLPSIPPYPYWLYLAATVALPFIARRMAPAELFDDTAVVSLNQAMQPKRLKLIPV